MNRIAGAVGGMVILIGLFLMSGIVLMASNALETTDWVNLNNTFIKRWGDTAIGNYQFNNTNMTIIGDLNVTGNWYATNWTSINYQTYNITQDLVVGGQYCNNTNCYSIADFIRVYNSTYAVWNEVVMRDGTTPLTANWNAGAYNITAQNFIGDGSQLTNVNASGGGSYNETYHNASVLVNNYLNQNVSKQSIPYFNEVKAGYNGKEARLYTDSNGNTFLIGGATYPTIYVGGFYKLSIAVTSGQATISSSDVTRIAFGRKITPSSNKSIGLGDTTYAWNDLYVGTIYEGSAGATSSGLDAINNINFNENNIEIMKSQFPEQIKKKTAILLNNYKVIEWLNATINGSNYKLLINYSCSECETSETITKNVTQDYITKVNETIKIIEDRIDVTGQSITLTNNEYIKQSLINETYLSVFDELRMTQNAIKELNNKSETENNNLSNTISNLEDIINGMTNVLNNICVNNPLLCKTPTGGI